MMNYSDLVRAARSLLQAIDENGVNVKDWRMLDLYDDYMRMKAEGHKLQYITYYLCDQYGVGTATVSRVVKRMQRELGSG